MEQDRKNPFATDRALVEKLWEGNEVAWEYVLSRTVIPMTREDRYYHILRDRQISEYDILGMVFEVLVAQKKLSLFRFECPFFLWVRHYVTKKIMEFCKKNPRPVSDEAFLQVRAGESTAESPDDDLEFAQRCFRELWRKNPMRAYVHLLKVKNGMAARDIKKLLSLSSEDNVYQLHSRAVADMREIRRGMLNGGLR